MSFTGAERIGHRYEQALVLACEVGADGARLCSQVAPISQSPVQEPHDLGVGEHSIGFVPAGRNSDHRPCAALELTAGT
ncbi:hypothetical protein [Mycolicibacterium grossiae]|uniref:hypothetical protein n=1 Tax=Mycolicibacterium grossiae TaxID=1552759 RepID=UPI001FE4F7BB|nr:hypothetical protein [Mycolicibacterium grossiae]